MGIESTFVRSATALGTAALLLLGGAASASADEMSYRVSTYLGTYDVRPVGDVEGHIAGPFVRRGLAFFANGDVALYANRGTLDMTRGKGIARGETTVTFDDGSGFVTRYETDIAPGDGGKPAYRGTGELVGGSGRYASIAGKVAITGASLTPFAGETRSDAYFDIVMQYTLPK